MKKSTNVKDEKIGVNIPGLVFCFFWGLKLTTGEGVLDGRNTLFRKHESVLKQNTFKNALHVLKPGQFKRLRPFGPWEILSDFYPRSQPAS